MDLTPLIEAVSYSIQYGNGGFGGAMLLLTAILGGTTTACADQLRRVVVYWLAARERLALEDKRTAQYVALGQLSEKAQLKLIETFPGYDPEDEADVEAAKLAEKELALLEMRADLEEAS